LAGWGKTLPFEGKRGWVIGTLSPSFAMSDFKKLRVWRKAHALTLNIHRIASSIRGTQYAPLRNQMIRAAMSVEANIVEGREQLSERQFARFLGYAIASASELEQHVLVGKDIRAITDTDYTSAVTQVIDVRKMLHGLRTTLSKSKPLTPKRPVTSSAAGSGQRSAGSTRQGS
jgi:four helix bundle protein